jgi:hypothetical protein
MDEHTRSKVCFLTHGDTSPSAWAFATAELAAWLQAEVADVRKQRNPSELPRKYWVAPACEEGGHDPRGTATWLGDALYIPSPAEEEAASDY